MTGINKKQMVGIFAFCFTAMTTNMTMGIIAYIMQSYSNVSPTIVSNLLAMPPLVGTVYAFCVGFLHKKIPGKYLMLAAQGALFLYGMIFLFFGGNAPIGVLLAAAGLAGIGQGSNNTLLAIALSEAVPDENRRGGVLGICMSVMNIGGVLFTTLGGALAVNRWNNAYYLCFIVLAGMALQLLFLPLGKCSEAAEPGQQKASGKLPWKVWLISGHYFIFFLALYVFGLNVSEYVITTHQLGTSVESGIAASMVTMGGVLAGVLFGVYSKALKKFTVPVLMGMTVVGLVIPIFITTSILAIYTCGFLLGFAMMGANPYIIGMLGRIVPKEQYSKALGVFSGFMNGGMVVAVTVIAFFTKLICGDAGHVPTKFVVGAIGAAFCFITSFPIYLSKDNK